MNGEVRFKTKQELYSRVTPALYSKVKELRRLGVDYVDEKDIWNYLVQYEWSNRKNLELHNLISDILNTDNFKIRDYVMKKMSNLKRGNSIINNDNI